MNSQSGRVSIGISTGKEKETKKRRKAKDMNANYTNPNIVTQKQNQLEKQLAVEKKRHL